MKNRVMMLGLAAPLALGLAGPVAAQDDATAPPAGAAVFTAPALDAAQQARLPLAQQAIEKIFPAGTYRRMMDQSLQPMMDSIMAQVGALPIADLVRMTGLPESEFSGIGQGTLAEMMAIIDPAFDQRRSVATNVTMRWMVDLMDRMEPGFRAGMARAYATRFTETELNALNAFFATPEGGRYATESMLVMMDPQVMAAMGEMMPAMMETMPAMMADMQQQMEGLPRARGMSDLSDAERQKLAELMGVAPDTLK